MRAMRAGAVVLALACAAGCTASTPAARRPAAPSPSTSTTTRPAETGTPVPVTTSTAPLSRFEHDPAVRALRAWALQFARAINSGHDDDAALNRLMTAHLAATMATIAGGEIGHRYLGPLPFTPIRVRRTSATSRDVHVCFVANGFSIDPVTGRPFAPRRISAADAGAIERAGRWIVSKWNVATFSCARAEVPQPPF